jgi:hypothetical protein
MLTTVAVIYFAAGLRSFSFVSANDERRQYNDLKLHEFQQIMRTGLDSELVKIINDSLQNANAIAMYPYDDTRSMHIKRSNVRRRRTNNHDDTHTDNNSASSIAELVWEDITHHAWNKAKTIQRYGHRGLSTTSNPKDAYPCPFLVCIRGHHLGRNSVKDILAMFDTDEEDDQYVIVSSSSDEICFILSTTAYKAEHVMKSNQGSQRVVVVPIVDISKIHVETMDDITSQGWIVPFHDQQGRVRNNASTKNQTETMNDWERILVVNFAPGLGGMKEEAQLLDVVNKMMGDVQDMGEVGWLTSMQKDEAEQFLVNESIHHVPALSDMFSLTSSILPVLATIREDDNARIQFWHDSFHNGLESEHACSEMFTTLFVKPRSDYFGFDIVLNPQDGPPATHYESSASNPACLVSLIAALSVHPYVLSVEANFPIYHGWNIAQKLDLAS